MKRQILSLLTVSMIATSVFAAGEAQSWRTVGAATAACGAQLVLNYNVRTGAKVLSVNNSRCTFIRIQTMGFLRQESLLSGQNLNIDVTGLNGDIIPVEIDGQFLQIATYGVANAQREEQQRRQQQAQDTAVAVGVGGAVAVGVGVVVVDQVSKGEH